MRRPPLKPSGKQAARSPHKGDKQPNPYVVAILTATLAGIFSVIGGYFAAVFQAEHAMAQKQFEYRVAAYEAFLDKTDRNRAPAISQILNIGTMAEHLATDGEIQAFEDCIAELLNKHSAEELYWQLNADLNVLRLHGSERISKICSDILLALMLRDYEINWQAYPPDVIALHERWKIAQEKGISYGWEARVTDDEILMVVTIAKLTQVLVQQLKSEIRGPGA